MNESNGKAPDAVPTPGPTIVDSECVIPYLANQLQQERALLNARISELLYENSLKAGYIDQLKKELASLKVEPEAKAKMEEFLHQE